MGRTRFIKAAELKERLGEVVLVDCELAPAYDRLHIPNAFGSPCRYWKEQGTDSGLLGISDPERFGELVKDWGLERGSTVVAYDHSGGLNAARLGWTLERFGFSRVLVLDGGLDAWYDSGFTLTSKRPEARPSTFSFRGPLDDAHCTLADIALGLNERRDFLWDNRSRDEWVKGRIPGARHLEWSSLLRSDGHLLDRTRLSAQLERLGLQPEMPVTVYCQGGIRAAHSYWVLKDLGFSEARVFDGSWAQYKSSGLPVEH